MPDKEHFDLPNVAKELVKGVAHVQKMLDENANCYIQHWSAVTDCLGIDQVARGFAEEILVSPLRLSEYDISLQIALTKYQKRDFKISAAVFGAPVHTFYRSRFNASRLTISQIEVSCHATVGNL